MDRLRIFGIGAALCIAAIAGGLALATIARQTSADIPGYRPPSTGIGQALAAEPSATSAPSATTAPTAQPTARPTTAPAPTDRPTAPPAPTAAPTEAPSAPAAQDTPTAAPPTYIEYTVQKGDLLYNIAKRYGVTIEDILAINQIPDPRSLTIGQVIRLPRR